MILGIDSSTSINLSAAKILRENGISFVGRYLVPAGMGKNLTATEIATIHNAGLAILPCWEIEAAAVKEGAERGSKDGYRAKQLAMQFGMPSGCTIFFACDYFATESDYPIIEQYIRAAQAAVYPYIAGVYGHAGIVDYLGNRRACDRFWQCVAWSSGRVSKYTNVYQYQWQGGADAQEIYRKVGFFVDMNRTESMDAAGLWMPKQEPHWYDDTVLWAVKEGVIAPVKTIADARPEDYGTRAEMMQMIRNYATRNEEADEKTDSGLLS